MKIVQTSLSESVTQHLAERILCGELPAGSVLPGENELATVSRGVVELRLRKIRAWRRISLLWRSSRFSRSSVFQTLTFSGGESTITAPGIPLMLVVHQTRRVSGVQPIFGTMEQIAAHWESYSP